MEHKLILGGNEFLPFARSCVTKLKKLGLSHASQAYEVGGVSIKVRIEPGHEYIRIEGGGPLLSGFIANGGVEGEILDENGNMVGLTTTFPATETPAEGQIKYYMQKFWPRVDQRPKKLSGWLTRGKQSRELANLDLSFNGTILKGIINGVYPDQRASKYGKRAPASLYSGTMRKVVQVLLGACEGEPHVERTPEPDRLFLGFNNADIPYDYTGAQSHGVFTCSDHTKEKPNVWIIEISAARGISAWKMNTRKVSKSQDPALYDALGYMPVATPRPLPSESETRTLVTLWTGGGVLSDYFGHEPIHDDCGWAFSYSGKKAANTSLEFIRTESGVRLLSVWAHLWELEFSEGSVTVGDKTSLAPTQVSVLEHSRHRAMFGPTADMKVPKIADVGRTLLSLMWGIQYTPWPTESFTFPVYVFYGHDSDDRRVFTCVNKGQPPATTTTFTDDTSFGPGATSGNSIRANIRTLRSGTEYEGIAGGFTGPGLPGMVNERRASYAQNVVTLGEYSGGVLAMGGGVYAPSYKIRTLHSAHFEEHGRVQSLIIPFGDREAVYIFTIKIDTVVDRERSGAEIIGIPNGRALSLSLSDVWNTDGSYWGYRAVYTPNVVLYDAPSDGIGGASSLAAVPLGGGSYDVPVGGSAPTVATPASTPLDLVPEIASYSFPKTLTLVTSAMSVTVPTYGSIYIDPNGTEPYNTEQFVIPGDTMGNKLIDCTSEAFTGAVSASEGIYRASKYDTFVSSGTDYYPATEIGFRWGYWVGVPLYKKAT